MVGGEFYVARFDLRCATPDQTKISEVNELQWNPQFRIDDRVVSLKGLSILRSPARSFLVVIYNTILLYDLYIRVHGLTI